MRERGNEEKEIREGGTEGCNEKEKVIRGITV